MSYFCRSGLFFNLTKDYFSNDKALNDTLYRSKCHCYCVAYEGAKLMKNSVGKKKKEGKN